MNILYSTSRMLAPYLRGPMNSLIEHNPDVMIYVFTEDDELPFEIPCRHKIINISQQTYFPKDSPNMQTWLLKQLRQTTVKLLLQ